MNTYSKPILASAMKKQDPYAFLHNIARVHLSLPTWLALGAIVQAALFALPIRRSFAVLPAAVYLLITIVDTAMISTGWKTNHFLARADQRRITAQIPDKNGSFMDSANAKICVFIIGFTCYHPLGLLAPGCKEIGEHFQAMNKELDETRETNGMLGITSLNDITHKDRAGTYNIYYFRSKEDVLAFSQGPVHRRGWDWYNRVHKQHPHIGIMHELYEAPAGSWEVVGKHHEPIGLAGGQVPVYDSMGEKKWLSTVVEAKGRLLTTKGRLGQSEAY